MPGRRPHDDLVYADVVGLLRDRRPQQAVSGDAGGGAVTEETLWRSATALLPPDDARAALECRGIGEQEAALRLIVAGFLGPGAALGETLRAELSVLTEAWGIREELAADLARCAGGPEAEPSTLRLIGTADAVALPRPAAGGGCAPEEPVVVPWITCLCCTRILGRAHRREWWGDLSFLAEHYVLHTPGDPARTRVFGCDEVFEALGELRRPPRQSGGDTVRLTPSP
ncbi:hypothetical protein ADK82_02985 [Streptomyces sp. NRRL S-4]|nr:hypothetical protein ADK82_02985 [Streptomyces sp. NRRL S-4]